MKNKKNTSHIKKRKFKTTSLPPLGRTIDLAGGIREIRARGETRLHYIIYKNNNNNHNNHNSQRGLRKVPAEYQEKAHSKSCSKLKMTSTQFTHLFLRKKEEFPLVTNHNNDKTSAAITFENKRKSGP